jgi:hypothetical protein
MVVIAVPVVTSFCLLAVVAPIVAASGHQAADSATFPSLTPTAAQQSARTLARPGRPTAKTPTGTISTANPTFKWGKAARATRYEVRVYEGKALVLKKTGLRKVSWTSSKALPRDISLSWKVRARNGAGSGIWSKSRKFETSAAAPGQPFLISATEADQDRPAIYGDVVAWGDDRNGNLDIFGYNLETQNEFPVCVAAGHQWFPAVSSDTVIWVDWATASLWGYDIPSTRTFVISRDIGDCRKLGVSGHTVVWSEYDDGAGGVFGYDLSTESRFPICVGSATAAEPAISGDIVVWCDDRYGDLDIYGFNLATKTEFPICLDGGDQMEPSVSGDWVVWWADGGGICGFNLATGSEVNIADSGCSILGPPIVSGDTVVWSDDSRDEGDIYGYDLSTGTTFPILVAAGTQWQPTISGDTVVWQDYDADWNPKLRGVVLKR